MFSTFAFFIKLFFIKLFQSFQSAKQSLRTTPVRLMVVVQALAIAAQLSVLLTADRYQQLFTQEAATLLGGDLVLNADREPTADTQHAIEQFHLQLAKTIQFNSVALSVPTTNTNNTNTNTNTNINTKDTSSKTSQQTLQTLQTLVSVKAVDTQYPLRGALQLGKSLGLLNQTNTTNTTNKTPAHGQVWVDVGVLEALGLQVGDALQLGNSSFQIAAIITQEPDRGLQFTNLAPRVLMAQADVAATQLLGIGSRATYRWQLMGDIANQAQFKEWFNTHRLLGQRLETLEEGRPEMRLTLNRASRFLGLIAVLSTVIAACGLGLVAHTWQQEQALPVALWRTLGASRHTVAKRLLGQLSVASALGLVLGWLLGYGLHCVLAQYLTLVQTVILPESSALPYAQALVLLVLLLVACVAVPMVRLINTPPIHVLRPPNTISTATATATQLRATFNHSRVYAAVYYGVAGLGLSGLLILMAGDMRQGLIVLGALLGVIIVLMLAVMGLSRLALIAGRGHMSWTLRTAARGLLRNPALIKVQAVSLTLALLSIMLLYQLQYHVLAAWQTVLPVHAPNHFIFNIQPDQTQAVALHLHSMGINDVLVQPMIRARLVQVNSKPIDVNRLTDERAIALLNREFNLSYTNTLPKGNTIVAGHWHGHGHGDNQAFNQLSVEAGVLKTLGLQLGDQLTFDVAGQAVGYTITSVRQLHWESLNVNFFVIASPNTTPIAVADLPQTGIISAFIPEGVSLTPLVQMVPNITVLNVGIMAAQVTGILNKVGRALAWLLGLGVAAGGLVVMIVAYASRLTRQTERRLLHILGATRRQILSAHWLEQSIIGGIAGLIAGAGSYLAVQSLAFYVLELPVQLSLWSIVGAACLGILTTIASNILFLWLDSK